MYDKFKIKLFVDKERHSFVGKFTFTVFFFLNTISVYIFMNKIRYTFK